MSKTKTKGTAVQSQFAQRAKEIQEAQSDAEPVRPSPEGTVIRIDGPPEFNVSKRTGKEYGSLECTKVKSLNPYKVADLSTLLFFGNGKLGNQLLQEIASLVADLGGDENDLVGQIVSVKGTPEAKSNGGFQWVEWKDVSVEIVEVPKQTKLAEPDYPDDE